MHTFVFNPYSLIFYNSLQSYILLSLYSENAWFAALGFGGYNIAVATTMAFLGSMLAMIMNYGLGFYISRWRDELPAFSEAAYQRVSGLFRRKLFLFMAVPPLFLLEIMPGLSLFVAINGMLRVPPKRAIAAVAVSRFLYYAYYLAHQH